MLHFAAVMGFATKKKKKKKQCFIMDVLRGIGFVGFVFWGASCLRANVAFGRYVNVVIGKLAQAMGKPVFMDVGGTDAALDLALMPYLTVFLTWA